MTNWMKRRIKRSRAHCRRASLQHRQHTSMHEETDESKRKERKVKRAKETEKNS